MASTPSEFNLVTLDQLPALTDPLADTSLFYVLQYDPVNSVYQEEANKVTLGTVSNYFTKDFGTSVNYNAGTSPNQVLLIPSSGKIPDNLVSDTFAKSADLTAHIDNKSNPHTTTYQQVISAIAQGGRLAASWQGGVIFSNDMSWKEEIYPSYRSVQYNNGDNYHTWVVSPNQAALYGSYDRVVRGYYIENNGQLSIKGVPVSVLTPTEATHAANKDYVDNKISQGTTCNKVVQVPGDTIIIDPETNGHNPMYVISFSGLVGEIAFDTTKFTSTDVYYEFKVLIKNTTGSQITITWNVNSNPFDTKIDGYRNAFCNFKLLPTSAGLSPFVLTSIDVI